MLSGRKDIVRKNAVIRQNHQPRGVLIQSAGREKLSALICLWHKRENGRLCFILGCGNIALRLMQHEVNLLFENERLAVNGNDACFGVCLPRGGGHSLPIYSNPLMLHQIFHITAGIKPL